MTSSYFFSNKSESFVTVYWVTERVPGLCDFVVTVSSFSRLCDVDSD